MGTVSIAPSWVTPWRVMKQCTLLRSRCPSGFCQDKKANVTTVTDMTNLKLIFLQLSINIPVSVKTYKCEHFRCILLYFLLGRNCKHTNIAQNHEPLCIHHPVPIIGNISPVQFQLYPHLQCLVVCRCILIPVPDITHFICSTSVCISERTC